MSQTDLFVGLCDSLGIIANPAVDLQYRKNMIQQKMVQTGVNENSKAYPRKITKMMKICRYLLLGKKLNKVYATSGSS
ncbi:hypothetical protein TrispH2_011854 [Trichoplax sp. H2]|nr:hypothetical protein TrispH2_011854 [Trichoplax sp. H2]|eukprot:RDD36328.1 hypothetical protein TrispH2_011854 [Trichoplax sp. H2]